MRFEKTIGGALHEVFSEALVQMYGCLAGGLAGENLTPSVPTDTADPFGLPLVDHARPYFAPSINDVTQGYGRTSIIGPRVHKECGILH
jgi:hypothetical protein